MKNHYFRSYFFTYINSFDEFFTFLDGIWLDEKKPRKLINHHQFPLIKENKRDLMYAYQGALDANRWRHKHWTLDIISNGSVATSITNKRETSFHISSSYYFIRNANRDIVGLERRFSQLQDIIIIGVGFCANCDKRTGQAIEKRLR